ncbi:SDR family NAD(P)-dependent oxidoreductase [Chitinimonas sp. BJB300]|uniref:SDR family NAD(P)-dependent oxidoreductase n=1 Tax=Chitinimonas sp. BJB300 TaxID=1559339 RepID=UPI000C10D62A|nr:SDR family oxidoreductase [Chitinimonas sp. BJB300]PHV13232.1 short-chain dehydrogenase [Chitinimonas sp. BJB300]TSJ89625.1 SDR family oxidoreductase [Chitinimonas sp. BJB300]
MRTAIVTGGSSGIGAAICQRFLDEGWRVISVSRRHPELAGVHHVAIDLAQPDWCASRLETCLGDHSGPLTLVHNAAAFSHDKADAVDAAYLESAFRLMVASPAKLNQLLAPRLVPDSSILYLGSTLADIAVPGAFSYSALKHATIGMMRATQQDFSGRSVHSCCICPGVTATPMVVANTAIDETFLRERVSFGRLVEPTEIASLAYFCAVSPSLNGAVLHANLGQINR